MQKTIHPPPPGPLVWQKARVLEGYATFLKGWINYIYPSSFLLDSWDSICILVVEWRAKAHNIAWGRNLKSGIHSLHCAVQRTKVIKSKVTGKLFWSKYNRVFWDHLYLPHVLLLVVVGFYMHTTPPPALQTFPQEM